MLTTAMFEGGCVMKDLFVVLPFSCFVLGGSMLAAGERGSRQPSYFPLEYMYVHAWVAPFVQRRAHRLYIGQNDSAGLCVSCCVLS